MGKTRKWFRIIHRDLSYFFAGVVLIYAFTGILLNHKRDFNASVDISRKEYVLTETVPLEKELWTKETVLKVLTPLKEDKNYTKHYFPQDNQLKVFLKGGSSFQLNLDSKQVVYESVRRRPIIAALNRLHYNPNRWWTIFSDVFAGSLIIITITGLVIVPGKKGLKGRGAIELIVGLLIPLLFIFVF